MGGARVCVRGRIGSACVKKTVIIPSPSAAQSRAPGEHCDGRGRLPQTLVGTPRCREALLGACGHPYCLESLQRALLVATGLRGCSPLRSSAAVGSAWLAARDGAVPASAE